MKRLLTVLFVALSSLAEAQELRLPFADRWFVVQGGDTVNVNEHMRARPQAFGIDFAKVGGPSGRQLSPGPPTRVEDFFGWGAVVQAPAAGTVVAVVTDLPDNPLGTKDSRNVFGNHVVIRIRDDRFVFVAHMQKGSVTAKVGDTLTAGQSIGRCGNSGNSDYPHIHLHVQDSAAPSAGTGQMPVFAPINVELSGKQFEGVSWPLIRGLFVSNK